MVQVCFTAIRSNRACHHLFLALSSGWRGGRIARKNTNSGLWGGGLRPQTNLCTQNWPPISGSFNECHFSLEEKYFHQVGGWVGQIPGRRGSSPVSLSNPLVVSCSLLCWVPLRHRHSFSRGMKGAHEGKGNRQGMFSSKTFFGKQNCRNSGKSRSRKKVCSWSITQ